jgi:hypothetical protein
MLTDPIMTSQLAKERQARFLHEVEGDRLAAERLRRRRAGLMLRLSNLLVYGGLWLRSRAERLPSAEAIPAGRWHALPLVMLKMAGGQATGASLQWWPVYSLGIPSIARASGYAIVPAAWLGSADMR